MRMELCRYIKIRGKITDAGMWTDLPSPDRAAGDARAGLPPPAPPDIRGHSSRASKLGPRPSKILYLHPETVQWSMMQTL